MNKLNLLKGFNSHLDDFFNDIVRVFPNDLEIKTAQVSLSNLMKANPKIIVGIWKTYISNHYTLEIENGNIDFFLNKNYTSDLKDSSNHKEILDKINRMKNSINLMSDEDKQKTIKYLQNLNKLCNLYH